MKRLKSLFKMVLLTTSIFLCAWTEQSGAVERISLAQAVRIALDRNLTMSDSRLAVGEKEYRRREAFSDFFPSGVAQYNGVIDRYYYYLSDFSMAGLASLGFHPSRYEGFQQIVRTEPLDQHPQYPYRIDPYRQFTGAVTITQPIFTGGKLINDYKFAKLGVDYSSIQYEVNRQDLILKVNQAYYQLMLSKKLLQVANESIKALEGLRDQTMKFFKVGLVPKVDLLSTEGQLAQAKIQRTQSLADISQNKALLNYLLRNPQETPVEIVDDMSYQPNKYTLPDVYATAAANRLEIRQAGISVDQALLLTKSAKAALMPNADITVTSIRYNDDWNIVDPEGTNDCQLQGLCNWTFDMFRRRSSVQEKRTTSSRALINRKLLVEAIMNEVKQVYEDMKRSESDIGDNLKAVDYRRESFRINRLDYEQQVATYVEVLDAQRQLALAEAGCYLSIASYKVNQAILERKMGILK